jgi:glutamine amidotransferase
MIAIIDYGMGNLRSVEKAFIHLGFNPKITSNPDEIINSEKAVLPGVGAFGDCLNGLIEKNLYETVENFIKSGKYFLGICVGMQLLFEKSLEFGEHKGFGFFKGTVQKFPEEIINQNMKIPHMGWNNISIIKKNPILSNIKNYSYLYFVHSFYAPVVEDTVALCNYGIDFTALAARQNVMATQFHPEKSQKIGLNILKNFGDL